MRTVYQAEYRLNANDRWTIAGYFDNAADAERAVSHFGDDGWSIRPLDVCASFGEFKSLLSKTSAWLDTEIKLKEAVRAMPE